MFRRNKETHVRKYTYNLSIKEMTVPALVKATEILLVYLHAT